MLEQNQANLVATHVPVKRNNSIDESAQFTEQFHAYQAATDDRECEESAFTLRFSLDVGALKAFDQAVRSSMASAKVLKVNANSEPGIIPRFVIAPSASTSWS